MQNLPGVSADYNNEFFIKRDDLAGPVPGGNKARKLEYIMGEVKKKGCNHVITCGSVFSNHCRLTAMAANKLDIDCTLVLNETDTDAENEKIIAGNNYFIFQLMDVNIKLIERSAREETMQQKYQELKQKGERPYLIKAGGNEPAGVHGYVEAAAEIKEQSQLSGDKFDLIFLASGTGTTQAGLLIGNRLHRCAESVIGISIEDGEKEGRQKIKESIEQYCRHKGLDSSLIKADIHFVDDYRGEGYGKLDKEVAAMIEYAVSRENILFDPTYTGKAFSGMLNFLKAHNIKNKKVLFLHSGGLPILFSKRQEVIDYLGKEGGE